MKWVRKKLRIHRWKSFRLFILCMIISTILVVTTKPHLNHGSLVLPSMIDMEYKFLTEVFSWQDSFKFDINQVHNNKQYALSEKLPIQGSYQHFFIPKTSILAIKPTENKKIFTMNEGLVVFVGTIKEMGLTVLIQHKSGYQTMIASLSQVHVQNHDWMNQGEIVGEIGEKPCLISFHQYGRALDPREVVNL